MKSKTLSKVTWYVFCWVVACIGLMSTEAGRVFLHKVLPGKLEVFIPASWFLLFLLIASRVFSYLALSAHKGQPIDVLVFSYRFFYILLTDEAREEWKSFIAKERERINKKIDSSI